MSKVNKRKKADIFEYDEESYKYNSKYPLLDRHLIVEWRGNRTIPIYKPTQPISHRWKLIHDYTDMIPDPPVRVEVYEVMYRRVENFTPDNSMEVTRRDFPLQYEVTVEDAEELEFETPQKRQRKNSFDEGAEEQKEISP